MQIHRDAVTKSDGTLIIDRSPNREIYGSDGIHLLVPFSVACRQDGQPGVKDVLLGALHRAKILDTVGGEIGEIHRCDWPAASLGAIDPIVRVDLGGPPPAAWEVRPAASTVPDNTPLRLQVIDPATGDLVTLDTFRLHIADGPGPRPYPTPNHRVRAYLAEVDAGTVAPGPQLEGARVIRADTGELVGMLLDDGPTVFVYPG